MKATFWDVKEKKKVETKVTEAVEYANGRHAFKGKTADGRNLTVFVSKAKYDEFCAGKGKSCGTKKCGKK